MSDQNNSQPSPDTQDQAAASTPTPTKATKGKGAKVARVRSLVGPFNILHTNTVIGDGEEKKEENDPPDSEAPPLKPFHLPTHGSKIPQWVGGINFSRRTREFAGFEGSSDPSVQGDHPEDPLVEGEVVQEGEGPLRILHFAEPSVTAGEVGGGVGGDEELASAGVLSGEGHADAPGSVPGQAVFATDRVAGPSVHGVQRGAHLDDEVGDDPGNAPSVEEPLLGQEEQVGRVDRREPSVQTENQ